MNNNFLVYALTISFMFILPVCAQSTAEIKSGETKSENALPDTKNTYKGLEATFLGSDAEVSQIKIEESKTATGLIGRVLRNSQEEKIGNIKDIILSESGKIKYVIISDGILPGLEGKFFSVDYNQINVREDGYVVSNLTQETLEKSPVFSYARDNNSENIQKLTLNDISVEALLNGQAVDQKLENIAEIENVSFEDEQAKEVILGFGKIIGLGGHNVAINFKDGKIIRSGDLYDFQITNDKAAQLETYKKSVTK